MDFFIECIWIYIDRQVGRQIHFLPTYTLHTLYLPSTNPTQANHPIFFKTMMQNQVLNLDGGNQGFFDYIWYGMVDVMHNAEFHSCSATPRMHTYHILRYFEPLFFLVTRNNIYQQIEYMHPFCCLFVDLLFPWFLVVSGKGQRVSLTIFVIDMVFEGLFMIL